MGVERGRKRGMEPRRMKIDRMKINPGMPVMRRRETEISKLFEPWPPSISVENRPRLCRSTSFALVVQPWIAEYQAERP